MCEGDEGGDDVRALRFVMVVPAKKIRGNGGDKIAAVLFAKGLAHFQAREIGGGVAFISRLNGAGEK